MKANKRTREENGDEAAIAAPPTHYRKLDHGDDDIPIKQLYKPMTINVGGTLFTTTLSTLTKSFPESHLAWLFRNHACMGRDDKGNCFLDANPALFACILEVLRRPALSLKCPPHVLDISGWEQELRRWGLHSEFELSVQSEYDEHYRKWSLKQSKLDQCLLRHLLRFINVKNITFDTRSRSEPILQNCYTIRGKAEKLDLREEMDLVVYIKENVEHVGALMERLFMHHRIVIESSPVEELNAIEYQTLRSCYTDKHLPKRATVVYIIFEPLMK